MSLTKRLFDDSIWSLKFRPQEIDDVVIPLKLKEYFKSIIMSNNVPNLLFYGNAGVGKTTLAVILSEKLDRDYLYINGSLETSIDVIRGKVTQFVSTVSMNGDKKIVIFDEASNMSNSCQDSLKVFIEEFSNTCSFIFISNHVNKIIPPLVSRLESIEFSFTKEELTDLRKQFGRILLDILAKEGYTDKYDKKVLAHIVKQNFPDFRKILNQTQLYAKQGRLNDLTLIAESSSDTEEYFRLVKDKDFNGIVAYVATVNNSNEFFSKIYDTCRMYVEPSTLPSLILLLGEYSFKANSVIDPRINLSAFSVSVMRECKFQ